MSANVTNLLLYDDGRFTDTSVQTAANRGFGVNNGILNVDDGKFVDLAAPVTVVSKTDKDGNVTYSVKYEKKGFVMSIR